MQSLSRMTRYGVVAMVAMSTFGLLAIMAAYLYLSPGLPSIEALKDVQLQVPLRIYSHDGALIAEYGEKKRIPMRYHEVPDLLTRAVLAAEDDRFFEHPGVDYQGILRAVYHLLKTGEKGQGGSTITMQVARNFFLSSEKTYARKLNEIFLALEIEGELSKEEILELYLNKIYLGHRAYGFAAAADVYYGKSLDELDTAQLAMLAGLPKAPSRDNPIVNPERALTRRNYVLGRLHQLGAIDDISYELALAAPVTAERHGKTLELEAPDIAEMVRVEIIKQYGDAAYTSGLHVYTTVDARLQHAANAALRRSMLGYDRRHGYRGAEVHLELPEDAGPEQWQQLLTDAKKGTVGGLKAGLVVSLEEQAAYVYTPDEELLRIDWPGLNWARAYVNENRMGAQLSRADQVLKPGDVIRYDISDEGYWQLAQIPEVAGALVSLRPNDGAVQSLVGGFDFYQSNFNRVIQAERQPGSNFKPFVYSAALEKGFTAASLINDAPVVFDDAELEGAWRPENYSGKFYGPTRLREALVRSRNLVSIRLLRSSGIRFTLNHVARFGFDTEHLPRDLSLALGSASITPYQLVRGYATFANGGYLIEPYFIQRIEDMNGQIVMQTNPLRACPECEYSLAQAAAVLPERASAEDVSKMEVAKEQILLEEAMLVLENTSETMDVDMVTGMDEEIPVMVTPAIRLAERVVSPQNIYLMRSMMQDVVNRGTGRRALALGRKDLAGKTGTTNEQRDAWFSGFNQGVVTTTWVGFDSPRPLGVRETGSSAALPMWVDYMKHGLEEVPEYRLEQPPGMVTVRIDPESGMLAAPDNSDAIFEIFRQENMPEARQQVDVDLSMGADMDMDEEMSTSIPTEDSGALTDQLF